MRQPRSRPGSIVRIGAITAGAILISSASLAGSSSTAVQYYVNVQPIQVCPGSDFTNCARISEPNSPSGVVGFVDPNGADITRAILNQAGVDVNFLSVQRYSSSPDPSSPLNTLFLMKGNVAGQLMSADLQGLTFQNQISQGTPPNPNPFSVPLNPDSHTLNMAFVTGLHPVDVTGVYYGLSWIGNNGGSVDTSIFGSQPRPPIIVGAVPDAIAHEIVHNFGLDHDTENMDMKPGNLMSVMRTPVTIPNALTMLGQGGGTGVADQLNPQQIHDIIDPAHPGATGPPTLTNSFLNPIPEIDTQIDNSTELADYSVNFKGGGRPGETLQTLTLTAPASFLFEEGTFDLLDGNTSGITAAPTFLNNCRTFGEEQEACQSLMLTFGGTPFVMQNRFDYTVDVCQISTSSCDLVPLADLVNDLNGGTYTYKFSDGYQTTSILRPLGDPVLDADSWHPDLTIPTSLDLSLFTPFFTGLPCVMQPGATTCPELNLSADRYDLLIFSDVPEPPSVAVLCAGFGFWLIFDAARRRRASYSIPALRRPSRKWSTPARAL